MINVSEDVLKLATALSRPIEELELSTRSWNCLRRWELYTVGDICKAYYEGKLSKVRNMGPKSIYEIEHAIDKYLLKDSISRQAAIDFIDAGRLCNPNEPRWSDNEVVNFLKSRPAVQTDLSGYSDKLWEAAYERGKKDAQTEQITCEGCRHIRSYDTDFPCSGCIRREKDYYEREE